MIKGLGSHLLPDSQIIGYLNDLRTSRITAAASSTVPWREWKVDKTFFVALPRYTRITEHPHLAAVTNLYIRILYRSVGSFGTVLRGRMRIGHGEFFGLIYIRIWIEHLTRPRDLDYQLLRLHTYSGPLHCVDARIWHKIY